MANGVSTPMHSVSMNCKLAGAIAMANQEVENMPSYSVVRQGQLECSTNATCMTTPAEHAELYTLCTTQCIVCSAHDPRCRDISHACATIQVQSGQY